MKNALLQLHLAVFLWGFTGVLGRAITLDAPVLVWWRVLLTAVIVAFFLTVRRQWVKVERGDVARLVAVGSLMAIHWVAFYGSIKASNASVALICLSTASVFTALLDPLVNKSRFDKWEVGIGIIALAGVWLIYRAQLAFGWGILLGVIAAVLSAIFTVLNKPVSTRYPARTVVFWEMTTGFILLSAILPFASDALHIERWWPRSPGLVIFPNQASTWELFKGYLAAPNDWLWLILLSLCCTVWAQSLAVSALRKLSSFTVTLSVNLEPLYGMALAFFFFDEAQELTAGFACGVALIFLSVVLQMARVVGPGWAARWVRWRSGLD